MVILDLWGISFHPAVVVGLGNDLLFNSILAHCERFLNTTPKLLNNLDPDHSFLSQEMFRKTSVWYEFTFISLYLIIQRRSLQYCIVINLL